MLTYADVCKRMRAVGCILAELLARKPLFPGKDYVDMLKLQVFFFFQGHILVFLEPA